MSDSQPSHFSVDVEATNRCNARCDFCPRDLTPHQGVMSPAVFERALARIVEFRELVLERLGAIVTMSFCGLGEGMLNRHLSEYIRDAVAAGFGPGLCSNASLLHEARARELLDAGLARIYINSAELDADYDRVYKVPFAKMRENVVRFLELAGDRCDVYIVLVDSRQDPDHVARVRSYWKELGVRYFYPSPMLNRSGALDVDGMAYEQYPEQLLARARFANVGVSPVCPAPFIFPFIGYDGQYYLCSSDWEKKVPLGSVFEASLVSILRKKWEHVEGREPICRTCNHDPINRVTGAMRKPREGNADDNVDDDAANAMAALAVEWTRAMRVLVERVSPAETGAASRAPKSGRRLIPVRAN
jgi:MoaA/NifB/PqqE/SkfB family radical SAM enzyme